MQWRIKSTILPVKQMSCPAPSLACRAPRVRATEYTPVVLRLQGGDCATGCLEVFSSTGGLLCLSKPLIRGARIKIMFLTQSGPVLGAAEMLSPISWTHQPFRFVALAYGDQRRLQAITRCSLKLEMPIPVQTSRMVDTEHQWIDKYRAAVSGNPPRRRLLKRMLGALRLGTK
jgi:hypothetical protein